MAHIDFKITSWERVQVSDDKVEEIISKIKSGEISSSEDLIELTINSEYLGIIDDTTEQMTIEENDGQSTIEILVDTETVFTNESL
jgi:hypothetical protein